VSPGARKKAAMPAIAGPSKRREGRQGSMLCDGENKERKGGGGCM
jgi:hypothetical protein